MHIFSVLPPRLGGLDMLLPLFMEIKQARPDVKITLLFLDDKVYSDLLRDPFLSNEVLRIVSSLRRFRIQTTAKANIMSSAPVLIHTLIDIAKSRKPLLLHSRGIDSYAMKLLNMIVKIKGGNSYQHFAGMPLMIDRESKSSTVKRSEGDGFLCFSQHDIRFLQGAGYRHVIPIGYTRLYKTWLKRIREVAPDYLSREFVELGLPPTRPYIALFLGSVVPNLYTSEEQEQWLQDVFAIAQKNLPDAVFLVKPHPVEKPHALKMIDDIVANYPMARLTHLHPGVLAAGAQLVVAHHTSTIVDSMAIGAPTIQYQELTPHWLKVHPEGSSFLKLGLLWARNREELHGCFKEAISDNYVVPDVSVPLKHNTNLNVFLGES